MRISDILGSKTNKTVGRISKITIGLIISGILSVILVFITIYGQYTGTYLIAVTDKAKYKGIAISDNRDFINQTDQIPFEPAIPLDNIEDIDESWLNIEGAINTDGQFTEPNQHYIAYTFYLKNIGHEAVNLQYMIKVVDDYRGIGKATVVKVIDFEVNNHENRVGNNNYSQQFTNSTTIATVDILNFKPGDVKKFTFFIWFDGQYSTEKMLGGAVKFEWTIGITSSAEDE